MLAEFIDDRDITHVIAISRSTTALPASFSGDGLSKLTCIDCDNQEQSMTEVVSQLEDTRGKIHHICICNGTLHGDGYFPERRLEEVTRETITHILQTNTITPILWLKHLKPLLKTKHKLSIAVLSARVGSISDNRLGGWYSYRSSKAALNMLLKTLSIELSRSLKQLQIYAFHPGTTDTELSKPFQARVAPEKLFSPKFVAERLHSLLTNKKPAGEIQFIDWDHKTIEW
ncbi:SDR family NAD(P)-dependent oxidoreductase [Aliikangiella marina]|uniref:SDR family NAD(P)-dependent oxidoreductase n=2 Tax=Aliikangiella marina TaxID=1712262 RepID=A0A545T7S4_9GAMM|nr:SDR family NAD(P)-dependent oxidoreductase [Aliikangiella marina]